MLAGLDIEIEFLFNDCPKTRATSFVRRADGRILLGVFGLRRAMLQK